MADPALELVDVRAGYGPREVLRGLSLRVERGELLALVGPNGCGKTTALRVASGVLRPTSGRVLVDGEDVTRLPARAVARRVAVLPQDAGPVFGVTALEAVLLGRHPWHPAFAFETARDVAAARDALAEVQADELADRDLLTLSGGERQRVLLARALCQGGDVLLCDEPTAHLDLGHQAAAFRLLRGLAKGGRAVAVVTHDLDLGARAADRMALLGAAGLVAAGPPREVLTPQNLRTAFGIEAVVRRDDDGHPYVLRQL